MKARLMSRLMHPASARLLGQGLISMTSLFLALGVTGTYGAASFGAISLMTIFANFILNVLRAALVEPATRVVARISPEARPDYLLRLARWIVAGMIVLTLPGWAVLEWLNGVMLDNPAAVTGWIATAYILSFVIAEILRAFYQAFAGNMRVLAFDIMRSVLALGALAWTLWGVRDLQGLSQPDLVMAGQSIALGLTLLAVTLGDLPKLLRKSPTPPPALTDHMALARMATLVAALRYLQVNAPALLAQYLLGETVLGIARTWQSLANIVTLPSNALRLNVMAAGSHRYETGGMAHLVADLRRITMRMLGLSVLMGLPMVALLYLLPDRYDLQGDGIAYLVLFILFNLLANTNTVLTTAFYSSGRMGVLVKRVIIGLPIALILTPVLIGQIGGLGIPVAQIATSAAILVMTMMFLRAMISKETP